MPNCPNCGSDDAQTLRMVHQTGIGSSSYSVGSSTVNVAHSTPMAREAAPPKGGGCGSMAQLMVGLFLAFMTWLSFGRLFAAMMHHGSPAQFWVALIPPAVIFTPFFFMYRASKRREEYYNAVELPERHARWERTWKCLRCGCEFEP